MGLLKKSKKEQMLEARQKRQGEESTMQIGELFKTRRLLKFTYFCILTFFVILICFVGQFPSGMQVLPNQIAKIRIVADFPYSYESQILTKRLEERLRKQIAPVYKLDHEPLSKFQKAIKELQVGMTSVESKLKPGDSKANDELVSKYLENFEKEHGIYIDPNDFLLILAKTDDKERKDLFSEGMLILKDIAHDGILPSKEEATGAKNAPESQVFLSFYVESQGVVSKIQNETEALRVLSINIGTLNVDWSAARAFFRILKNGVQPNFIFDADASEQKIKQALASQGPVVVQVREGQTIIEPGSTLGPEQIEQVKAYELARKKHEQLGFGFNVTLLERSLLTIAIMLTAAIYTRVGLPRLNQSFKRLVLASVIMLFSLFLIRLVLEFGESSIFENNPDALSILPFCAPMALGAIIIAIMIGPRPAILAAVLINIFYSMMLGSGVGFSLIGILSSIVGIYFCQNIRLRSQVVRAGFIAGVVIAISVVIMGITSGVELHLLGIQILASLIVGILMGFITIGLLPYLEKWFHFTTDITLLELTDYNHPLLRKLQLQAPGTYHHSLMVANLSERAAVEIHANPLLCRACCLFHDIGKITKPEYFVENQRDGQDPHLERNPSMSALVIKSHVKEGVLFAKKYKLPQVIIDVIEQHHGTTLIKYFFDKAQKKDQQADLPFDGQTVYDNDVIVDESTFRYEGPVPQFKESAIIMLADSVEAASRTLKKPSAVAIEELIDNIFKEKLNDHQFDECPLTFQEMQRIKKSFAFSILNMLHSRIEYPESGPKNNKNDRRANHPNN